MTENVLIPLPGFTLPPDFPWRVRFISAVNDHLRRLRATGYFLPPRFFGYYFRGPVPMAVSGNWTVTLDPEPPLTQLHEVLDRVTCGQFSIASASRDTVPEFMLVHDRHDGACWLWGFSHGLRFVESTDPVEGDDQSPGGTENQRLLGP